MPIGKIEDITLSLEDRDKKRSVEVIGVKETCQINSPPAQFF